MKRNAWILPGGSPLGAALVVLLVLSLSLVLQAQPLDLSKLPPRGDGGRLVYVDRHTADAPALVRNFRWMSTNADPVLSAIDFLGFFPDLAGIRDPVTDLALESVSAIGNKTVVKFRQVYGGLTVVGRKVIVNVDESGAVDYLAGNALPVDGEIDLEPSLDAAGAAGIAAASVAGTLARAPSSQLQVLVEPDGADLVWAVSIGTVLPVGSWVILVDAATGEVRGRIDRLMTVTGRVYEQNPNNGGLIEPELLRLSGDQSTLTGQYAVSYHYLIEGNTQTAIPDTDGNFLYDPTPSTAQPDYSDPFIEVQAYYHVDRIVDYFVTTHGYVQTRGPLTVQTNYYEGTTSAPTPYDNGFYDGETWTLTLGQGATVDFGYDATIIYHETGHSVVDSIASLITFGGDRYGMILMPGAIHEGVADYFAASLLDDSNMNEYIYIGRNLDNTNQCPTHMIGEPHQDGLVIGGTLWSMRELLGRELADRIVFGSLYGLPPDTSFLVIGNSMLDQIDTLIAEGTMTAAQKADVEAIFHERGMDICDRFIDLGGGESYSTLLFGLSMLDACDYISYAQSLGLSMPTAFQWYIDVPEDATTLEVDFSLTLSTPGDESHWIYFRKENPVEFEIVTVMPGFSLPLRVLTTDGTFENGSGFTLTPYTDPPLEAGKRYYIAISSLSCPMGHYTISAVTSNEPVPEPVPEVAEEAPEEEEAVAEIQEEDAQAAEPDAEEEEQGGGESGCGCQTVQ